MDVDSVSCSNARLAESRADLRDIPTLGDEGARVGVAQVVEGRRRLDDGAVAIRHRLQTRTLDGPSKSTPADVPMIVPRAGARRENQVVRGAAPGCHLALP